MTRNYRPRRRIPGWMIPPLVGGATAWALCAYGATGSATLLVAVIGCALRPDLAVQLGQGLYRMVRLAVSTATAIAVGIVEYLQANCSWSSTRAQATRAREHIAAHLHGIAHIGIFPIIFSTSLL